MTIVNLPVGGTENSQLISVVVNGVSYGTFDTFDGGDSVAAVAQHRSGGQRSMTSYRTLPKFGPVKVSRVLDLAVDWELIRTLRPMAGLVLASVTSQPLDADLNVYGNSQTSTGMFQGLDAIKTDSNSEALQYLTINITVDSWQ